MKWYNFQKGDAMEKAQKVETRQAWEFMKLTYVGHIREVVQLGGGKLSTTGGDPGEPRKQRGTG
jgi:hypothetical protein